MPTGYIEVVNKKTGKIEKCRADSLDYAKELGFVPRTVEDQAKANRIKNQAAPGTPVKPLPVGAGEDDEPDNDLQAELADKLDLPVGALKGQKISVR